MGQGLYQQGPLSQLKARRVAVAHEQLFELGEIES